jgi:hypothetical protein
MNTLGMQYVSQVLGEAVPQFSVESGYGGLIVEFGIAGIILWFVWVSALLWSGWSIVRQVRQTPYFPLAFAIWWYAVVMLVLLMYFGMQAYDNFVNNAYLWLLTGVLFRLPQIAQMPVPIAAPRNIRALSRWQFSAPRT